MSDNTLIAVAVGFGLLSFFSARGIINKIASDPDTLAAAPKVLKLDPDVWISDPVILAKERSNLDPSKVNLRAINPDGSLTTYQTDPEDFSVFQRLAISANRFKINNDTIKFGWW